MVNPARILDRGRLLLGLLVVVPVGALASTPSDSQQPAAKSQWTAQYGGPQAPAPSAVSAVDILAHVSTPAGGAATAGSQSGASGLVEEAGEAEVTTQLPAGYIAGSPPSADLAATLRRSEQRNRAGQVPDIRTAAVGLAGRPNMLFTRASQAEDLRSGQVDPRVVDLLTWIASRRQSITITSMRTDHSTCVAGSNPCRVSAHHVGRAFDVGAVNGQICTGVPGGECGRLYEEIVNTLRGTQYQPSQIIYGYDPWPTESWNFEMGNHHNHIHVGY